MNEPQVAPSRIVHGVEELRPGRHIPGVGPADPRPLGIPGEEVAQRFLVAVPQRLPSDRAPNRASPPRAGEPSPPGDGRNRAPTEERPGARRGGWRWSTRRNRTRRPPRSAACSARREDTTVRSDIWQSSRRVTDGEGSPAPCRPRSPDRHPRQQVSGSRAPPSSRYVRVRLPRRVGRARRPQPACAARSGRQSMRR